MSDDADLATHVDACVSRLLRQHGGRAHEIVFAQISQVPAGSLAHRVLSASERKLCPSSRKMKLVTRPVFK